MWEYNVVSVRFKFTSNFAKLDVFYRVKELSPGIIILENSSLVSPVVWGYYENTM